MDYNQDENQLKENAKATAKAVADVAVKKGSSMLVKYIGAALVPILPYILIAFLAIVILLAAYLGIENQMDTILSTSGDLGERLANAISGYGFKTEDQLEQQEEEYYYKQLLFFQQITNGISNYEFSLIQRTLLYEGNYEETVYITQLPNDTSFSFDGDVTSSSMNFLKFIKLFPLEFTQGFTNSFMGTSGFKKRTKFITELVAVVFKCKSLTGQTGGEERFDACYRGYLVADYDERLDKAVEKELISYDIKNDYFTYDDGTVFSEIFFYFKNIRDDFRNAIKVLISNIIESNSFMFMPLYMKLSFLYGYNIMDVQDWISNIIDILMLGKLATEGKTNHYYYKGYIVNTLQEYYKSDKSGYHITQSEECMKDENEKFLFFDDCEIAISDETIAKFNREKELREEIADDIFDAAYTYYRLQYGNFIKLSSPNDLPIMAGNEKNMSVEIEVDGQTINISFDDYLLLYALANYSDEIKKILESGSNIDAQLEALMIIVRTQLYKKNNIDNDTASIKGDSSVYEDGNSALDGLSDEEKNLLLTIIQNSRGSVIKNKGNGYYNVTSDQIDDILNNAKENGDSKSAITSEIPDADLNKSYLVLGDYDYISDPYGASRGSGTVHYGIDYSAAEGTPIYSVSDGTVYSVTNYCSDPYSSTCGGGFGYNVYVKYENGDGNVYYVIYAHMSYVNVKKGDVVDPGVSLGGVGTTGSSTGNHLHLEVRKNDPSNKTTTNRVNPEDLFPKSSLYK